MPRLIQLKPPSAAGGRRSNRRYSLVATVGGLMGTKMNPTRGSVLIDQEYVRGIAYDVHDLIREVAAGKHDHRKQPLCVGWIGGVSYPRTEPSRRVASAKAWSEHAQAYVYSGMYMPISEELF